jgi:hypothetical protein
LIVHFLETSARGLVGEIPDLGGRGLAVVMPSIDLHQAVQAARRMIALAGMPLCMVIVDDRVRQGFVKTLNDTAQRLNAEYLAYVAQDALAGKDWLKNAHEKITSENKSVCAFNDGIFFGGLAQFGLVRTSFTDEHYGGRRIFFPGYRTHRADEDLSHLAHALGQYTYAPNALLMEVHYGVQRDINKQDVELYVKRKEYILTLAAPRNA